MTAALGVGAPVGCLSIARVGLVSNWVFAAAVLVSLVLMVGYAVVIFWPEVKAWVAGCLKGRRRAG